MSCYREIGTVQKSYQYVGHEENTYRKNFDTADVRLCLAFPDAYEIGMSNVGMQILYHVVNERPGYLADRAYAPLEDMAAMLKRTGQTLKARESSRDLAEFDLVGFTLQYELCYTNILYMLDLGGIARRASQRDANAPLVMGGGPCAFNPEPVAAFFDFFVIGEGEEVLVEVLDALAAAKKRGASREEKLMALGTVPGVYVPANYTAVYRDDGEFVELAPHAGAPRWVERRIIKDLNSVPYPVAPVTSAVQPVHERVAVEVQRGCTRACRFCQAGYIYRPRRERDPAKVLSIIDQSIAATGITDIGLLSLSSADYSQIHPVMQTLIAKYKDQRLSVSLPSTRLEALDESYLDVLKEERRSGFTIAPEAGSQRLRNVINKNFTEDEVMETARMLFRNGWQSIKMYFMIGQPTETDEDVIAIAELGNAVIRKTSDIPGRKQITISVSNFVPKPHTPFQWHEQITHADILRKQKLVRDHIQYKDKIQFRSHSADNSFAEGLVARADRRAADLIERAYDLGAVFDCWQEKFDVDKWRRAAAELKEESGYDFVRGGLRGRGLEERLPWHRIYCGIHPKFFKNEFKKAVYGIATEDCSFGACHECGLCTEKNGVQPVVYQRPEKAAAKNISTPASACGEPSRASRTFRFQYVKNGVGAYVSILDLQTMLARAMRRAGIDIVIDDGIRPRPKISMGSALPVGVASTSELFDVELRTTMAPAAVVQAVNRFLPDDLALQTGAVLEKSDLSLAKLIRAVTYRIERADLRAAGLDDTAQDARLASIAAAPKLIVQRRRKTRDGDTRLSVINLKDSLEAVHTDDGGIIFTFYAPGGQAVSPYVMVEALLGADHPHFPLKKTGFLTTKEKGPLLAGRLTDSDDSKSSDYI